MHPGKGEIGVYLPGSGETALLCDENSMLNEVQRQLACAWTALEKGERNLILPVHATRSIDTLARQFRAQTRYIAGENGLWMHALVQENPLQFRLQFDGIRFALSFISLLCEKRLTLNHWRQQMPAACRSVQDIQVPACESGRLLHRIAESDKNAQLGGGVRLTRENGWAWLGLDERSAQLHIIAEAANMETSREICDFYGSEISRLLAVQD